MSKSEEVSAPDFQGPVRLGYNIEFFRKIGSEGITCVGEYNDDAQQIFRISSKREYKPSYYNQSFITEVEREFIDFLNHNQLGILRQIIPLNPCKTSKEQIENLKIKSQIFCKILEDLSIMANIKYIYFEGLTFIDSENYDYWSEFREEFKKQYKLLIKSPQFSKIVSPIKFKTIHQKVSNYINEDNYDEYDLSDRIYFQCKCGDFFNFLDDYNDEWGECWDCYHIGECKICGHSVDLRYPENCNGCEGYWNAMHEYSTSSEVAALGFREGNYDLYNTLEMW